MIRTTEYLGFPNCIELSNDAARLVISTDFGPRILFYGLDESSNVLGWHPHAAVETELGTWKPYGGHRLWVAPENMPLSYEPDNELVEHGSDGELTVRVGSAGTTGIGKEMRISISSSGPTVNIEHTLSNGTNRAIDMAAWALTIMRDGGTAVIPNEQFRSYSSESLLPVRSMAVWSYTNFADPRWEFTADEIRLKCDPAHDSQQKVGVLNSRGMLRYEMDDVIFTKRYELTPEAVYPDLNSNTEVYTAGGFIELETLSPLQRVQPGGTIKHTENWDLARL